MKRFFILMASSLLFVACDSRAKNEMAEKINYEKAKESLKEKEMKSPSSFLTVTSRDKRNLLGQTVIKGTVINNAKICSYTDVQVELAFYSKTGTLLEKDKETIYESIKPGKEQDFKTKYFAPKGTDSVALKIIAAKPAI